METNETADAIRIVDLELRLRIGVPEEERAKPQRLTISITLWPQMGFDQMQDEIGRTVNYAEVVREVKETAGARTDQLIETLAEHIASLLLHNFPIRKVQVELKKFILPEVNHVAVLLTRERSAAG